MAENHGSLFLIRPVSQSGQLWLDENVGDENTLTFGGAIVCELRYVEAIAQGAVQAGLVVYRGPAQLADVSAGCSAYFAPPS